MPHFERYYTVEEANALLPELRAVLATIRQARDQLADSWHQAEPVIRAASTNGGGQEAAGYLAARFDVGEHLRWFRERGILLKDIDRGLVDFPALREGEEVLLCWELSEEQVAFWHSLAAGYAGRQRW
jgi:hypothetical protein